MVEGVVRHMAAWRLELLGGFRLLRDGQAIPLSGKKDRLLLAMLALEDGRPVARDRLAGLLWADRAEEQARASLRQSLASLRTAFREDENLLDAGRETVALRRDTRMQEVDADGLRQAMSGPAGALEAVALYTGPLLDGLDAPSPECEAWLLAERQALETGTTRLIEHLSQEALAPEAATQVLGRARDILRRDPLNEAVTRAAMRLLTRSGQRSEAARLYQACAAALEFELGVGPEELTKALFDALRADGREKPAMAEAVHAASSAGGERPTLAVTPFQNISGDPSLSTLCEGLAEDITAGLGRFRLFSVIDRHSASTVAALTSDVREIGARLGADLVIQGSLQRAAEGYRLGVRLIEAETRVQRWAGDFRVAEADVLQAPHKIMAAVLPSIRAQAETSLIARSRRRPVLAAYEHLLIGIRHLRGYGPEDNRLAIEHFDKAVALDPGFALALAYRGFADVVFHGYDGTPPSILQSAAERIRSAADLDPDEPRIWWLLGMTVSYMGDFVAEERFYRRAHELNPNDADVLTALAMVTVMKGERAQGLAMFQEAFRLNPFRPEWYWVDYGSALYVCERYEEALDAYSHRLAPNVWVLCRMAACLAQLGRMDEAAKVVAQVMALRPGFRLSQQRSGSWGPADTKLFRDGMLRAGLPE